MNTVTLLGIDIGKNTFHLHGQDARGHQVLRNNGIQNLVVAGFLTNCCVEGTVRSGYEKGYNVVTLSDCTATFTSEQQQAAEQFTLPMFSQVLQHTQFLETLSR